MQVFEDKQDVAPVAYCAMCGEEIYPGEIALKVDEGLMHDELSCIQWYINEHYLATNDAADLLLEIIGISREVAR